MSKASPCPSPEAGKNYTDDPNGVSSITPSGYLSFFPPDAVGLLLQLQQVIIDLYSQNFVLPISPKEAQGMLTLMSWGMAP